MRLRTILLSIPALVAVLVSAVFLYGNAHKRHSTVEQFAVAERNAFRAYGANPESHFVTLPGSGIRTHYLESGRGLPLLAIHGGNSMSAAWAPLVPALAGISRLIMVDRPGCGLTDKLNYRGISFRQHSVGFTREFLDSIGVRKTSIIGNSMGGYFAVAFALAYPDRVDKLILIGDPPMVTHDRVDLGHRMLSIRGLNSFLYALQATAESLGGPGKPPSWLYARPETLRPEFIAAQRSAQALPGAEESWLTMVEEVLRHYKTTYNLKNELDRLQASTLFIVGDKEDINTTGEFTAVMPKATKVVIPNAAHIVWADDTQACARAILEFLAETPNAVGTRTWSLNLEPSLTAPAQER